MTDKAERLKFARERAGYSSAKDAADAMGIPTATYIQHENGHRGYPASKADRYARFFRVKPEWLLYGNGSASQSQGSAGRDLPSEAVLTSTFALLLDSIGVDPNINGRAQRLAKSFPAAVQAIEDLRHQATAAPAVGDLKEPHAQGLKHSQA